MDLFQDLSAAEELVFTFHLRLAERDSEVPLGEQLDVKKNANVNVPNLRWCKMR
jgi:hypothetical protein